MKDSRFLRELEDDSVDTDILDEELNSIKDEQAKTFETQTRFPGNRMSA